MPQVVWKDVALSTWDKLALYRSSRLVRVDDYGVGLVQIESAAGAPNMYR